MKNRITAVLLAASLLLGTYGCGAQPQSGQVPDEKTPPPKVTSQPPVPAELSLRTAFLQSQDAYHLDFEPSVKPYTVKEDFSNVINYESIYYVFDEAAKQKLLENGFVVIADGGDEFFNIYEMNRYDFTPNFITTDSMMHTYHLYFSHLLKGVETEYFYQDLTEISRIMQAESLLQCETLKGTAWENAAMRNAAFFSVGLSLLQGQAEIPASVQEVVREELALIEAASSIADSPAMNLGGTPEGLLPLLEDYTQYIPRGYYTTSEELTRYFKAMMWYGRISFRQSDEDQSRSALLMTTALENTAAAALWEKIYSITGFFVGSSDDPGIYEYGQAITQVYGGWPSLEELPQKQEEWTAFRKQASTIRPPVVNSIPILNETLQPDKDGAVQSFRFMGQRTTLDAAVFQQLVYREVGENSAGELRMLPSALDIPAVLGSASAQKILADAGAEDFAGYSDNRNALQAYFEAAPETVWSGNLYSSWIDTLRPLLTEKGEGYPQFMQNQAWTVKNLNSFLGSWTELKHDTVLYAKQVYAEMGGGGVEEADDRGYVEPEPLLYMRLSALSQATIDGLKRYGVLRDADAESLGRLAELAQRLALMSEKELQGKLLNEAEYELIRSFGGQLEHFWYEALKDEKGGEEISFTDFPAAVVADVATDPNGSVLEVGSGRIDSIYVIVDVGGDLRIAKGGVFSFYEFEQPISERLTDKEWRLMLGIDIEFIDGEFIDRKVDVPNPEWTSQFRVERIW